MIIIILHQRKKKMAGKNTPVLFIEDAADTIVYTQFIFYTSFFDITSIKITGIPFDNKQSVEQRILHSKNSKDYSIIYL